MAKRMNNIYFIAKSTFGSPVCETKKSFHLTQARITRTQVFVKKACKISCHMKIHFVTELAVAVFFKGVREEN